MAKLLLERGASVNTTDYLYFQNALHYSISPICRHYTVHIFYLLLEYGGDYNSYNKWGYSAFHLGKHRNWVNKSLLIIFDLAAERGNIAIYIYMVPI